MSERDTFWAAIWANPFDFLPRLVFADWLDERAEVELANELRDTAGWQAAFDFVKPYAIHNLQDKARDYEPAATSDDDVLELIRKWHSGVMKYGKSAQLGWTMFPPAELTDDQEVALKFFRSVERVAMQKLPDEITNPSNDSFEDCCDMFSCCD